MFAVTRRGRLLPQHGQRGAHEIEHRGLEGPHLVPVARDAEALANGRHAAQQQRWGDGHHRCVQVVHGVGAVQHVIRAQAQPLNHQPRVAQHKAVRNHRRLGAAGGARGVQQQTQVGKAHHRARQGGGVRLDLAQCLIREAAWRGCWRAGGQPVVAHKHQLADERQHRQHLGQRRVQGGIRDHQPTLNQVNCVTQRSAAKRGVDWRRDRAQLGQRKPQHSESNAVGQQQADVVALAHALRVQAGSHPVGFGIEPAVGPFATGHADEGLVGHIGRSRAQRLT